MVLVKLYFRKQCNYLSKQFKRTFFLLLSGVFFFGKLDHLSDWMKATGRTKVSFFFAEKEKIMQNCILKEDKPLFLSLLLFRLGEAENAVLCHWSQCQEMFNIWLFFQFWGHVFLVLFPLLFFFFCIWINKKPETFSVHFLNVFNYL